MAKKRQDGEGSIARDPNGNWVGKVSLGFEAGGKRIRKTVYGKSQQEVRDKIQELRKRHRSGQKVTSRQTLSDYLTKWLDDDVDQRLAHKTAYEYRGVVDRHIVPYLGVKHLQRLAPVDVRGWQASLQRDGFSASARRRALTILKAAMNSAIRLDLLDRNPCSHVTAPKVQKREIQVLDVEQCGDLFRECGQYRLGDMVTLAAMTGLRKAELFGLEWQDVNLSEGVLVVRRALEEVAGKLVIKQPKTKSSRRPVILDPIAISALRSRKQKAEAENMTVDLVKIVFPNTQGGYERCSNFDRRTWYPIRKAAGIPETLRFHDLRHTQASLLLAAGVHPKVVQERLGHADIQMTLNTYSHLLSGLQAAAVDGLAQLHIRNPHAISTELTE